MIGDFSMRFSYMVHSLTFNRDENSIGPAFIGTDQAIRKKLQCDPEHATCFQNHREHPEPMPHS
jgi:hypothetical protein